MTTSVRPYVVASTQPDLSCCACSVYGPGRFLVADPKHALVFICQRCGHQTCEQHTRGMICWGCDVEGR